MKQPGLAGGVSPPVWVLFEIWGKKMRQAEQNALSVLLKYLNVDEPTVYVLLWGTATLWANLGRQGAVLAGVTRSALHPDRQAVSWEFIEREGVPRLNLHPVVQQRIVRAIDYCDSEHQVVLIVAVETPVEGVFTK